MGENGYIYAIGSEGLPSVKIGKTTGPVARRLAALQIGQPVPLKILAVVPVDHNLSHIEKAVHRFLVTERQQGEWFAVQVDQAQLEALMVRAVQWLADEDARRTVPATVPAAGGCRTLGDRLKLIREKRGMSQNELSRRTGVRQALISEIESGTKDDTTGKNLRRLALELGVTVDYLIGMYEDENSQIEAAAEAMVGA